MAGSWNHSITDDGKLLDPISLSGMLENGGDVHEYAEEAYGMVWWLAQQLADVSDGTTADWVSRAQESYREGIAGSPGIEEV